ncbi:MAG: hypothetical protein DWQ47_04695 [Acidobacteria bacterium]|nr:MAG: hypothetical protein DWQ32_08245 [Acidobacteriota bacterium]REK01684.1 MAG: hypothetical protein DWQ38_04680 [Acidobacteriota bacterium]REK14640.1 MAG: hypothetical protein DWQ43_13935 [Acidobacteriota bacterium]REK45355.1 MAG: hypothetical protein DWQ47_04695 [Acidobacteriota bacterium]
MPRRKKSRYGKYVFYDAAGRLYARVQIRQNDGSYKTIKKRAENLTHVSQLASEIKGQYSARGQRFIESRDMRFEDLAAWYKEEYLVEAVYDKNGVKVSGMRSWKAERNKLDRISRFFVKMKLDEITADDLTAFKRRRSRDGVSITTVNRDLELLRTMFNRAVRKGWLKVNPFRYGERLIEKSLEKRRSRTITKQEEARLLKAAKQKDSYLYYALLMLRDTGARPSEIYNVNGNAGRPVRWKDLQEHDFKACTLYSFKGKRVESRVVPVTKRLSVALTELWLKSEMELDSFVFPVKSFKKTWSLVRQEANLPDLRLRDLRRDFRTRLAKKGFPDHLAQRLLGHKTATMSYNYTEADEEAVHLARRMLDADDDGTGPLG